MSVDESKAPLRQLTVPQLAARATALAGDDVGTHAARVLKRAARALLRARTRREQLAAIELLTTGLRRYHHTTRLGRLAVVAARVARRLDARGDL